MKIDVLIPAYNSARCICEALESVERQTRHADAIVVHDDASRDDTVAVLQAAAATNPLIAVHRSAVNRGILESRQLLVEQSTGDVVCFLDHDDRWPPDYLARIESELGDPAVAATVARARHIGPGGRWTSVDPVRDEPLRGSAFREGVRTIFMEYPAATWSCIALRRTVAQRLRELHGFTSGEEFAMLALALEQGDIRFMNGRCVTRTLGGNNAILHADRQHEAELTLLRWFSARYPWLSPELPAKVMSIYGNSVCRQLHAGNTGAARALLLGIARGVFHRKNFTAAAACLLGPRIVAVLRPPK